MNYSVEVNGVVYCFTFEHDAKHYAIDEAYKGVKGLFIKHYNKTIYRVAQFGNCYAVERV